MKSVIFFWFPLYIVFHTFLKQHNHMKNILQRIARENSMVLFKINKIKVYYTGPLNLHVGTLSPFFFVWNRNVISLKQGHVERVVSLGTF